MSQFDQDVYARTLKHAGVAEPQALAHGKALAQVLTETRAFIVANDADADAEIVRRLAMSEARLSDNQAALKEISNQLERSRLQQSGLFVVLMGTLLLLIVLIAATLIRVW